MITNLKYTKMTGSGNDFILIDNMDLALSVDELKPLVPKLCARGLSIGADGFIVIEPYSKSNADFKWHFYNSDGSIGEMCGNGARCAARFAYLHGHAGKEMTFLTEAGLINATILDDTSNGKTNVKVQLTPPHSLKIDQSIAGFKEFGTYSYIDTGVPHIVIYVEGLEQINVQALGSALRYHERFAPNGTNVNFISQLDDRSIRMRTYERGVEAETLACGTGATASALIAIEQGHASSPVRIITSGGSALIVSLGNDGEVFLEGEARILSRGEIDSEAYTY